MDIDRFLEIVQDAVASKRVLKWGYARTFGGLYPTECDSVAAHMGAVTPLAAVLSLELSPEIERRTGVAPNIETTLLMAAFHDFGEARSGDTGASSHGIRGFCNLHTLEREALGVSLHNFRVYDKVMALFDDYRAYRTAESLLVHTADTIEGFEKALHAAKGNRAILLTARRIAAENLRIFRQRQEFEPGLGHVARYLADEILEPCLLALCRIYGVQLDFQQADGHSTPGSDTPRDETMHSI